VPLVSAEAIRLCERRETSSFQTRFMDQDNEKDSWNI